MADEILASLREKTIQNHRLESQVGEMEIRISHHVEDLTKARAERDQSEADCKELSSQLAAQSEELKEIKVKYEALKLLMAPQVDHKRKRDAEESDFKLLAPAFREQGRQNTNAHWSSMNSIVSQFMDSRYESSPTTPQPQRPSMLSYLSTTSTESSSPSTNSSPRASPGLQAELRATGHSTPWSQMQHVNPYSSLQSSPMSTRSNTPIVQDHQRTTDPRKRVKVDANQPTPPVTPTRSKTTLDQNSTPTTTTTTTHITQTQTVTSPPKRPAGRATPNKTHIPQAPVSEGPRILSESRKRTISLLATPLRSSPRRATSSYRKLEDGELPEKSERQGYCSPSPKSS
ncbi:hypothetical protein FB451DRAFT_1227605 [Mycena latifolia]|nr:hypothetical protein FB451DRAFT_1227605 [Mycena latifolia]